MISILTLLIIWKLILARWSRSTQTKQKNHNLRIGCGPGAISCPFCDASCSLFYQLVAIEVFSRLLHLSDSLGLVVAFSSSLQVVLRQLLSKTFFSVALTSCHPLPFL